MNKEQNLNEALTGNSDKADVMRSFFGRNSLPQLKLTKTWKSFTVNFFEGTKFRIWLYISKFREEPLHFCLIIGGVISLDTAHVGKRICGRLNLTRLFKKDFHVYTSGDSVQSPKNYA